MMFTETVEKIRLIKGTKNVPGFDPNNGNENAQYLFLLEAPGQGSVKSGYISFDNNDATARNLSAQLATAGVNRSEIAIWNTVPWYLGEVDFSKIRSPKPSEIIEAQDYLMEVIDRMPALKCIVLVGAQARRLHLFLSTRVSVRIITCHHTSIQVANRNSTAAQQNIEIFQMMQK
ncbi:uracil-DNA glycosylase superfamily protein [Advenella kashmirensis WT001]|uniref:Uracil-DNA glycosylase superfamily protein n=1 Tax=Advenella kashmirensis (strain DSM 17095 / LMG 22695 / WT001) TaxID=1036672 RepID=I3UCN4_ADVKW|nr:uracil-DNA glycosylase [Advenella kashmirensis]AFK62772.1 uracil-DNA glycosylase superfamily protein [Advenella kashmirensis WT001]